MNKVIKRLFSTKKPKMELTIRTPYKTIVSNFTDFQRVVTKTSEAYLVVQNRMPPAVHVLPPGPLKIRMDKENPDVSGELLHTGGWLIINPDNTCEINLMECVDRKDVQADKLDKGELEPVEEGVAGQYVQKIRNSTVKSFQRNLTA